MKTLNSFGGKGGETEKTSMSGAQLTPYKGDARFMTVTDSYFAKNRLTGKVDQKDAEQLKNHYKFHKGTTYSIGTKGEGYDSGLNSLAKDSFLSPKKNEEKLPGRRNQDNNVNLIKNYQIGVNSPSVRGSDVATTQNRTYSTYNKSLSGQFTTQYQQSNDINKDLGKFVLSNKFEYGHDPEGGMKALKKDSLKNQNYKPAEKRANSINEFERLRGRD